jgi:small-conductance mechanosensitive channel
VQVAVWQAFRDHDIEIPFPQQVQYQVDLPSPAGEPSPPA